MPLGAVSSRLCPSSSSTGVSSAGPRMSRGDLNLLVVRLQAGGVHVARTSFRFCCPSAARGAARQPVHPRRRCGTPTCRCADGEGHASPALAYPAGGRTKTLTLTLQEAVEVAAALARYAQAKADLDEQAAAGLTALLARVAARRASRS